jgi:hypothetical protein
MQWAFHTLSSLDIPNINIIIIIIIINNSQHCFGQCWKTSLQAPIFLPNVGNPNR